MAIEDFVENFISLCIDKGINSPKAICEVALKEIQEIDEKLRESNKLRLRYKDLRSVLKNFNHESIRKTKDNIVSTYIETSDIKNSPYYNILIEVCEFINNSEELITSREIMDSIGNRENSQIIYGCIKTLADHGIISRDQDRHFIKGPKWEERPTELIKNSV